MTPRIAGFAETGAEASAVAAIDAIFFEASATQSFAGDAERAVFHERWLGRYLADFTDGCFVALGPDGRVLGYVVGATTDPARDPRFADIGYFSVLAAETRRFPAHLHINLAPEARNKGLGGRLIEAFCAHARAKGAHGVHVVTAAASRNRTFYARAGFTHVVEADWNGHAIVFLGRTLT
jgi:GNAT superfamily N-acetyltransferase